MSAEIVQETLKAPNLPEQPSSVPDEEPPMGLKEKLDLAHMLTVAMANRFDVPSDEFLLVQSTLAYNNNTVAMVYAAEHGISFGDPNDMNDPARSWRTIGSEQATSGFQVTVKRHDYDTRKGMTRDTYAAMVAKCMKIGRSIPDNHNINTGKNGPRTNTLLSGELVPNGYEALAAHSFGGSMVVNRIFDDTSRLLFRPAVIL